MSDRDTITLPREVVQEALEALCHARSRLDHAAAEMDCNVSVDALRTALAAEQPKPSEEAEALRRDAERFWMVVAAMNEKLKPVAWMFVNSDGECEQIQYGTPPTDDDSITPLYIAPPEDEALRRDAERYRWMATGDTRRRVCNILPLFNAYAYRKEHIDAAIDAAMKEGT